MSPIDAEEIANSIDPDQTAPVYRFPRLVCPKTRDHYNIIHSPLPLPPLLAMRWLKGVNSSLASSTVSYHGLVFWIFMWNYNQYRRWKKTFWKFVFFYGKRSSLYFPFPFAAIPLPQLLAVRWLKGVNSSLTLSTACLLQVKLVCLIFYEVGIGVESQSFKS